MFSFFNFAICIVWNIEFCIYLYLFRSAVLSYIKQHPSTKCPPLTLGDLISLVWLSYCHWLRVTISDGTIGKDEIGLNIKQVKQVHTLLVTTYIVHTIHIHTYMQYDQITHPSLQLLFAVLNHQHLAHFVICNCGRC